MNKEAHDSIMACVSRMRNDAAVKQADGTDVRKIINRTAMGLGIGSVALSAIPAFRGMASSMRFARHMKGLKRVPYAQLIEKGILPNNAKIVTDPTEIRNIVAPKTGNPVTDFIGGFKGRAAARAIQKGTNAAYAGFGKDHRPIFLGHPEGMPADIARHEVGHMRAHQGRYRQGYNRYRGIFSDYFGEMAVAGRTNLSPKAMMRKYTFKTPDGADTVPGLELEAWRQAPSPIENRETMRRALSTYILNRRAIAAGRLGGSVAYPSFAIQYFTRDKKPPVPNPEAGVSPQQMFSN